MTKLDWPAQQGMTVPRQHNALAERGPGGKHESQPADGSLGPVFTIALGYWILDEPVHWIQLAGAAIPAGKVGTAAAVISPSSSGVL